MSLLKFIKAQLGISSTPTNNFTLDASAQDGTMKLSRGNAGATTQDVVTVDAAGKVTMPQGIGSVGGLPAFQCRAWVNFDGTRDAAGVASAANTPRFIRASENVASVLRVDVGSYIITFSSPMPDANYAVAGMGVQNLRFDFATSPTSSGMKVAHSPYHGLVNTDSTHASVCIFR